MDIRRKVKNVVYKYSGPEKLVREATSNDPWGPTSTVMSAIADLTYDYISFEEIMPIIWKRLNDKGKNWRHVYKCLLLLDYLIKCGDERVAAICISNIHSIETLKDFQYFDEYKDLGLGVREKSKALVLLLRDDEELNLVRVKGQQVKEKFQSSTGSMGSRQQRRPGELGKEIRKQYDKETRYPKSVMQLNFDDVKHDADDEDLRKAIELSKEEHEKTMNKKREQERLESIKLKMALDKSQEEDEILAVLRPPPKTNDTTMSLALMTLSTGDLSQSKTIHKSNDTHRVLPEMNEVGDLEKYDPWATPSNGIAVDSISLDFDPWKTPAVDNNSVPNNVWPSKKIFPNKSIIDDIFGDDKPSIQFETSWITDSKTVTTDDNVNHAIDTGMIEPMSSIVHYSNNVTGSLSSLTDIGVDHNDNTMKHSSSVMNISSNKTMKTTPQDFLGDSAKLVNLDNLLTRPTSGNANYNGVYWDTTGHSHAQKNPFRLSSTASGNPFHNNVQNKTPMNAITTGVFDQSVTPPGNLYPCNINNNYNTLNQLPQSFIPKGLTQNHEYQISSNNGLDNNGNVSWTVNHPQTIQPQSNQWYTHTHNATLNPFIN